MNKSKFTVNHKTWLIYDDPDRAYMIYDQFCNLHGVTRVESAMARVYEIVVPISKKVGLLQTDSLSHDLAGALELSIDQLAQIHSWNRTASNPGDMSDKLDDLEPDDWEKIFQLAGQSMSSRLSVPTDSGLDRAVAKPSELVARRASEIQLDIELQQLNREFFDFLSRNPNLVYNLTPRRFEEIIAAILKDMGCEVEITPTTRDGGRDILATFKTRFGKLLTIVECKRYRADRKIGVDVIERFLWTMERKDKASCGLIATTSYFSADATAIANEYRYRLHLKDFDNLKEWVGNYGKWTEDEESGLWVPNV